MRDCCGVALGALGSEGEAVEEEGRVGKWEGTSRAGTLPRASRSASTRSRDPLSSDPLDPMDPEDGTHVQRRSPDLFLDVLC